MASNRTSSYQKYLNNHLNALSSSFNNKYIEKINMQLKLAEELVQSKKEFEEFIETIVVPDGLYYITKLMYALTKKEQLRNSRQYYDHFVQIVDSVKYMIIKRKQIDSFSYQGKMVNLPKRDGDQSRKKTLVLDLDETLVHCIQARENPDFGTGVPSPKGGASRKSSKSFRKLQVQREVIDVQLESGNWAKVTNQSF